jgi:hypothetical protein
MQDDSHRLALYQRALSWLLDVVDGRIIPALPRGLLRHRLRAYIDRAQSQLHSRVHEQHDPR